jgi:hypothetical protein
LGRSRRRANAACANPNLFQSLTLVDPVILPQGGVQLDRYVVGALLRRQSWSSRFVHPIRGHCVRIGTDVLVAICYREEAKKSFLQNPFFMPWDPEVLDIYVQYGLTDVPKSEGGGVRLKMTGFQVSSHSLLRIQCARDVIRFSPLRKQ